MRLEPNRPEDSPLSPLSERSVTNLPEAPTAQLRDFRSQLQAAHAALRAAGRELNLTRGKPATDQVALSDALLTAVTGRMDCLAEDGTDCTNYYGSPQGLIETRRLFATIMGVPPEQILIGNNSSLALMHDAVVFALLTGARDGGEPWSRGRKPIAFICPAPGYDRHFAICEQYGIRMIPVRLTGRGPDMDEVERLAADPQVKGMWCVPKYSNPTGETYAPEIVERLARMPAAADDFRVFWDNAYAVHTLTETLDDLANFIDACARTGHPDRALVFSSTSKITYAQAGLGLFAASPTNMAWYLKRLASRTIGPDKLNQLRHARMFSDAAAIHRHMQCQRQLIAPKFRAVLDVFRARLGGTGAARWAEPRGGYFISLDVMEGCAKRVAELAKDCGVAVVPAGRTFPYGRDPNDSNLRIAPTFPSVEEVRQAAEALATCTLLAATEKLLRDRGVND
jgi:DNA-binding transcriptional MocR family regulator